MFVSSVGSPIGALAGDSDAVRGAEQTRLRILAATRALYVTRGTKGTTTREVAVRAGVNEATLFRHFGTKQQLIDAMLVYYGRLDSPWHVIGHVSERATLAEQLCALGSAAVESMQRKEDIIRMALAEEISNPAGTSCAWTAHSDARAALVRFFEQKTAAGELAGEAELLACTFMSLFYSYVMAKKIWGPFDRSVDRVVPTIVDLFLHGAQTTH